MDAAYSVLKLGYPSSVVASLAVQVIEQTRPDGSPGSRRLDYKDSFPPATVVHYTFPARGKKLPAVKLHWYDGGILPERPEELEPDRRLPESGTIFVGEKGKLMCETYSESPRLIPEIAHAGLQAPEEDAPARPGRPRTSRTGSRGSRARRSRPATSTTRARSPRRCCSATWRLRSRPRA